MHREFAWIGTAIAASALLTPALPAHQQTEIGYSYLRLVIEGKPMENMALNPQYKGWLRLDGIDARAFPHIPNAPTEKAHSPGWTSLEKFLKDGANRSGELDFQAGDDGGLDPIFDAIKRRLIIPEADLDYFNFDTNALVGRFKLKGVQTLSMKNAPASACAAYVIRIRFRSIENR